MKSLPVLLVSALLTLPVLAAAQDTSLPEILPTTTSQPTSQPTLRPTAPSTPTPAEVALPGVSANLFVPRNVTGKVGLTFTVRNGSAAPITFGVRRDNDQNCATAPQVRVLQVGTREVVYPVPGAAPRLCAQDLETRTIAAKGNVTFTRELDLAPGDYMVESWLTPTGFVDKLEFKVPAPPVRITVK